MKLLGLNSPEIFLISVIILSIIGPKRIEKAWLQFQRLLKFLLSNDENFTQDKSNIDPLEELKEEVPQAIEEKVEAIEVELKQEEAKEEAPQAIEEKVEAIEAELKVEKLKVKKVKK